jgi:hypothetical protein
MALVTGNAEPTAPVGRHQSDAAAGTRPRAELDQVMMPADLERLHKELREFELGVRRDAALANLLTLPNFGHDQ